ncbi:MAG: UPF0280 family protein [Rhodobacter sp.]|nr:UPF0280 family protein [Rhodobacter sp.]
MQGAQARMLPDGRRLHLHHGPIDLIVEVSGAGRQAAQQRVVARFETVLQELVDQLSELRRSCIGLSPDLGPVARRMVSAVAPFEDFITPMAAVAGAVADEMIAVICGDDRVTKAYVNNGGDVAFHLSPGESLAAAIPGIGSARIGSDDRARGIATSGWRGRSHSLGIADSVTVLARNAAMADAAATLIANAVDLPAYPGIVRHPAHDLDPDSDLGARQVTTDVPVLAAAEKAQALERGLQVAGKFRNRDLIEGAWLHLQGAGCGTGALARIELEMQHA